jgi:hypothetical protein
MRPLAWGGLALLLVLALATACAGEPDPTDAEQVAEVNDGIGPVLVLPDGTELRVRILASLPGDLGPCEVELLADEFAFDLGAARRPELIVYARGDGDDLDSIAECAGLIEADE